MQTNQMADRVCAAKKFLIVDSNIRRIALQPGLRGSMGTVAGGSDDNPQGAPPLAIAGLGGAPASLSPNPKYLFDKNIKLELEEEKLQNCSPSRSAEAR
jgi:hypothetical protein